MVEVLLVQPVSSDLVTVLSLKDRIRPCLALRPKDGTRDQKSEARCCPSANFISEGIHVSFSTSQFSQNVQISVDELENNARIILDYS